MPSLCQVALCTADLPGTARTFVEVLGFADDLAHPGSRSLTGVEFRYDGGITELVNFGTAEEPRVSGPCSP